MKIFYTNSTLTQIPAAANACKRTFAVCTEKNHNAIGETTLNGGISFTACNYSITKTSINNNNNDANQKDASFSFLSVDAGHEIKLVASNNVNKENNSKTKKVSICSSTALMLIAAILFTQRIYAVTGPGATWQYVRKVTLSSSTPVASFQVKITLTTGSLGNPYTHFNSNGSDIRFYDINNNSCNYWIESFANNGTSTIWVNIPTSGSTAIYMYYGNTNAPATSNGATTFDFFDDFTGSSLAANWQKSTSNGSVSVSGGNVTLTCNSNSGSSFIASAFTPASASFILETNHQESRYYRNRFYAANVAFPNNPLGFDNGYFHTGNASNYTSAQVFWNNNFQATLNRNTDYLTQWKITDGSTYIWNTYKYSDLTLVQTNNTTYNPLARYITIGVTEASGTSTIVDWVRVRKSNSSFTDPTATIGSQISNNLSASIASQTNVLCYGQSTGSAKVTATGGATPYSYSWNSSPTQNTQTANNLSAGNSIATVTDNIGLSATATATITQPATAVNSNATGSNINCFNASDGQIEVTGSNGVLPYTFSIDNGASYYAGNSFTNLSVGVYKIRVKDNNGCESTLVP